METRERWRRIGTGHAVSNLIPVAAANRSENEEGQVFYGLSIIRNLLGRRCLTIVGAVLTSILIRSSAPALEPAKALTEYVLETWRPERGSVICVVQTRDGYLWLGTRNGLVRFDGVRFTAFDKETTPELGGRVIQALLEDASGSLWIGTSGGLTRFQDGHFSTLTTADGLSSDVITSLHRGKGGTLWIGTASGVARFVSGKVTPLPAASGELVHSLAEDHDGDLWAGTETGLKRYRDGRPAPPAL